MDWWVDGRDYCNYPLPTPRPGYLSILLLVKKSGDAKESASNFKRGDAECRSRINACGVVCMTIERYDLVRGNKTRRKVSGFPDIVCAYFIGSSFSLLDYAQLTCLKTRER